MNIEQKKEMREIIKDYIKIEKDNCFNFNIYTLPNYKFFELQKYADKCFTENMKNNTSKLSVKCREEKKSDVTIY